MIFRTYILLYKRLSNKIGIRTYGIHTYDILTQYDHYPFFLDDHLHIVLKKDMIIRHQDQNTLIFITHDCRRIGF